MNHPYLNDSWPWTRWWWFNVELREEDIRGQLDWLRVNGFGGVELAFVYALPGQKRGPDWLSPEWSAVVAFAKRYCDSIGLGCDFTFGTLWPYGGSMVSEHDSSQTFEGPSRQRLGRSWELPEQGRILNHLDAEALRRYSGRMGEVLKDALKGSKSALFCDSWEVETEGLWTLGLGEAFRERLGYDVRPYVPKLDEHPDVRYDYRKLLAEYVLGGFYRPLTDISHRLGSFTRVQCLGAPTDVLAAYAAADVPESEAILFDPEYARIPASAAALTGQPVVTAEAFTCLYGWIPYPGPGPHQGEEQVADLKLLVDALFANGVNHVFWHGMPYQRAQAQAQAGEANRFYASVHVGPDSLFAADLSAFNGYMERVCREMKRGRTYSDVAVYLPLEDNWMLGELPKERQKPSAKYHWELHYLRPPAELQGYQPLWVSTPFLKSACVEEGRMACSAPRFSLLYVDCEWLDVDALHEVLRLAHDGLPGCMKQKPSQPGFNRSKEHDRMLAALAALPNVSSELSVVFPSPPLVTGRDLPDFWCRVVDGDYLFFFGHPKSRGLTYPMKYGQSAQAGQTRRTVKLSYGSLASELELVLEFARYQSLLVRVSKSGTVEQLDIGYRPPEPRLDRSQAQ
jgi:hypothetical protein